VTKMDTDRIIHSLATYFGWELQQFDVKNAFLHEYLEEEVYMEIPPSFWSILEGNSVQVKQSLVWTQAVTPCLVW